MADISVTILGVVQFSDCKFFEKYIVYKLFKIWGSLNILKYTKWPQFPINLCTILDTD